MCSPGLRIFLSVRRRLSAALLRIACCVDARRGRCCSSAASGCARGDLSLLGAVCAQPMEIYVDDEAKLTLHGLVQHYIMLNEEEKNRKLNDLLDALDFNQVCCSSDNAGTKSRELAVGCIANSGWCCGTGGDLRKICDARQGTEQAARGVQLPVDLHPPRHEAGRAVRFFSSA